MPVRPAEPTDPLDVFPDLIERRSEVCKRCYTLLREREEYPAISGRRHHDRAAFIDLVEGSSFYGTDRYTETVKHPDRFESAAPPGEETGTTTACRCGAIETHRTPNTRSREDALRAAGGISQTLTELEVAHDWLVLFDRVRVFKQQPALAGDDFEVFRRAVGQAVEVARN